MRQHYSRIRRILILVLALNWLVAIAKIVYGTFTRCTSMTADGFHSLTDGASNIIGLVGISLACQPKDADHPYGHRKYETFFSLGIVLILVLVAIGLIHESLSRLRNPVIPEITIESFVIMVMTIAVNLWVMRYENKRGKMLGSDILISDAMHTKMDIFTSLSVIIALIVMKLGYPILDPIATLFITIFIGHGAYDIIKHSSSVLCDVAILDEKKIMDIVLAVKGVKACHKIRTRGRPDDIYVDLHVQVDPDMHIDDAHVISYAIEEEIKKQIPQVIDVIVHMEPEEA